MALVGRPRGPPGQREGRRLLPAAPTARAAGLCGRSSRRRSTTRSRPSRWSPASTSRTSSSRTSTSRCAPRRDYPIEAGHFRHQRRPGASPVEAIRRRGSPRSRCRTLTPCTPGSRRRPLRRGSACAVLAQPRPAAAGGPHGSRCRRAGPDLPQPVPIHRRPCRGARRGLRGGPADHRRLVRGRSALSARAAARRGRSRGD